MNVAMNKFPVALYLNVLRGLRRNLVEPTDSRAISETTLSDQCFHAGNCL